MSARTHTRLATAAGAITVAAGYALVAWLFLGV